MNHKFRAKDDICFDIIQASRTSEEFNLMVARHVSMSSSSVVLASDSGMHTQLAARQNNTCA